MLLPFLSAFAPVLLVPVVTSRFGPEGWGSYAVGQSIGAAAAVIVELGWGLTGTQRVARQAPEHRRRTLAFAGATQAMALPPVLVACAVVALVVAPRDAPVVAAIAAAACLGSVNGVWYFIGQGRPVDVLRADVAPKVGAMGLGALAVTLGASIWTIPAALCIGALSAQACTVRVTGLGRPDFRSCTLRRILHLQRAQASALAARALSATYIALPTALVALAAPPAVPVFAAADRLQRWVLTGLQPLPNTMQSWVGTPGERRRRVRRALAGVAVAAVVGIVVGAAFALAAPAASTVMFAGRLRVPESFALLGGMLIAVVCTSRATGGLLLVAVGAIPSITVSALAGCLVGAPVILGAASAWGAGGALAGVAATEGVVLTVQCVAAGVAVARMRRSRRTDRQRPTRVAFVRVDDPGYPRNARLRRYCADLGCEVAVLVRSHHPWRARRLFADVATILFRLRGYDVVVVAEFSLRFAPLIAFVAHRAGAVCVVDCFVRKEEIVIGDHGHARPRSLLGAFARLEDRWSARAGDVLLTDTHIRAEMLRAETGGRKPVLALPVGAPPWARPNGSHEPDSDEDAAGRVGATVAGDRNAVEAHCPSGGSLRVLFYGSFLPLHGVPIIVEAVALAGPRVRLTLVGDARRDTTRALVAAAGIEDRCVFVPSMPEPELAGVIAAHDVVLGVFGTSAKANSVIANKVWQGLAAGRLVITQRSPALAEIRALAPQQLIEVLPGDARALCLALQSCIGRGTEPRWQTTHALLEEYVSREFAAFGRVLGAAANGRRDSVVR